MTSFLIIRTSSIVTEPIPTKALPTDEPFWETADVSSLACTSTKCVPEERFSAMKLNELASSVASISRISSSVRVQTVFGSASKQSGDR